MHCKKSVLTAIIFSGAVFFLSSSLSHANLCPTSSPQDSQVFREFKKVLHTEYFGKSVSGEEHLFGDVTSWIMMGHALGRLANAVQGQPGRRAAFDCVQMGLEQIIALKELRTPEEQGQLFRAMMQAAFGMHDEEVKRLINGALPTGPLYHVLGGKIKSPISSKVPGGAEGGKVPAGKKTPTTTIKDPVVAGGVSSPGSSPGGGKVAQGGSSRGRCSNWMRMRFSDRKGNILTRDTGRACTLTGESGDFHTEIDPATRDCLICSLDDWTPPPPPIPPIDTSGGGTSGGTAGGGKVVSGDGVSDKRKCHLYSGYLFSKEAGTEFNVLQSKNPGKNGYVEFLYTVGTRLPFDKKHPPDYDYESRIKRARKEAKRIVKEGARGKQYTFAWRGGPDGFCNFIESQCDMKVSSVKVAAKACGWTK